MPGSKGKLPRVRSKSVSGTTGTERAATGRQLDDPSAWKQPSTTATVLPSRLAIATLAFAFDWLPHRPHVVTAREDRMRATLIIEGRLWCWLTFGQSLHLVHHLYPGVPFYRYATVWRERVKAQLAAYRAKSVSAGRAAGA